jgi:hypothetical protein
MLLAGMMVKIKEWQVVNVMIYLDKNGKLLKA